MPPKQALAGTRANMFIVDERDLTLVTDPTHYLYDERIHEPLSAEFIDNIAMYGPQLPLLVTKEGEQTLVVDGRKRVLSVRAILKDIDNYRGRFLEKDAAQPIAALREGGLRLKVIVVKGSPAELQELMILTNEARNEDTPLNKARKTQRYLDLVGGDKKRAAITFKVSVKTVEARLKFLELAPPVQQHVEQGRMGFWAATELATLPKEEQVTRATELLADSATTGKKPQQEDAKRKADKGEAKRRERLNEARAAVLDAALAYAEAGSHKSGVREAQTALHNAAVTYYEAKK